MRICKNKNNAGNNKVNITKNINVKIGKEGTFGNMANYVNFENLKVIENQKIKSICKIIKDNNKCGVGFLVLIPYPDRLNQLPVLLTCNHVIIGNENEIKLIFNDEIEKILKLNNSRKIYANKNKDITIIEIKKEDNYNFNKFLEIDYDIFDNHDLNEKFNSIYIIHYPSGKGSSLSIGIIEKIEDDLIEHKCATEKGSSGAPIINLNNLKIIGVHQGTEKALSLNFGMLLKDSINDFNKKEYPQKKKYNI